MGAVENLFTGLRAALFDLDGTLIETHIDFPLMKRETLALAERKGLETAGVESRDVLGIVESLREELERAGRAEDAAAFRREAFALLEEIEVSHCSRPAIIAGASELLRDLRRRGVPVAIVTRNCRRVSADLVDFGGLEHDALLTRDDVPLTKPHPGHLLSALQAVGADEPPSEAVMAGDHWMDVQGGRAAGMRTIGILRGRPPAFFDPARPDLLVSELAELVPLLDVASGPVPA
jgi:phosphoglycolate phosphatase